MVLNNRLVWTILKSWHDSESELRGQKFYSKQEAQLWKFSASLGSWTRMEEHILCSFFSWRNKVYFQPIKNSCNVYLFQRSKVKCCVITRAHDENVSITKDIMLLLINNITRTLLFRSSSLALSMEWTALPPERTVRHLCPVCKCPDRNQIKKGIRDLSIFTCLKSEIIERPHDSNILRRMK